MSSAYYLPDSFVKYHLSEAYNHVSTTAKTEAQIEDTARLWNRRIEMLDEGSGFVALSEMVDRLEERFTTDKGHISGDEELPYPEEHPFENAPALYRNRLFITRQILELFLLFGETWTWEEIEEAHESVNEKHATSL